MEAKAKKEMKVPRGTARALRRVGLVRNWRSIKGAKQMLPPGVKTAVAAVAQQ